MRSPTTIGLLLLCLPACSETTNQTTNKPPVSETTAVAPETLVTPSEHRPSSPTQPLDQEKPVSDEQVTANIRKAMMDSPMAVPLQKIKVNTNDGKVTLTGLVKTLEEKQKAGEIAETIAGSEQVNNWVEVE